MFNITDLYQIIKPDFNPRLITDYPLIFGGSDLNLNQVTGGFIISQISSQPIGSPVTKIVKNDDNTYSKIQESLLQNVYQVDFYKKYDVSDEGKMIHYLESNKLMEYLKSEDVLQSLKKLDCEILPNYTSISMTSEFTEVKDLINRATFDFTIITKTRIILGIIPLDKIEFEKEIII